MKFLRLVQILVMGVAVMVGASQTVLGQTLRVKSNPTDSTILVSLNRAVVVESDVPFAELSIANPGIADIATLSNTSIYLLGKAPGGTTMTLLRGDGSLIANVEVLVTADLGEFKGLLREILPSEPIEVRAANDGIVLSGQVSSAAKLDRALQLAERYAPGRVSNLMVVGGTQQVMLKVRFAEMQRSVSKSLTGSLGLRGTVGQASGVTVVEGATNSLMTNAAVQARNGLISTSFGVGNLQMQIALEALEAKGLVRTLAEPTLTALSGQKAKFLAGGEYPIPVVDVDRNVTITYKPFGVELNFVPRVVDGDQINLNLTAAVSSIDTNITVSNGGYALNAFKRRETSTTLEMRDGESLAIAGLLQDDFRDSANQVPWLGDLPILGALFRSASYARQQSELVIIITPHLVNPIRGDAFVLPTDRIRLPSETDLFLFGKVGHPTTGAVGEVARQDFNGSYGYVME
ncbi:MAG: type II and III secretion system protein family protein [Paracoccaceae bacterium]|nr:type II and III secretion system protein family protein [Paracoccaceae bacterium]MDP5345085.1 type II and III secretion system protein family protein [Paracoccaceae bacterium]